MGKIVRIGVLSLFVAGACGVYAAGYHIPTLNEGLLSQQGCYIGAYLGGDQGANDAQCINYFMKAQPFPYETQILDSPSEYGETVDKGIAGIDTGIDAFRRAVETVKSGTGNKQLLFSRYFNLLYYPDNNYGKIPYTESPACYVWAEAVLKQGGVPVLILYPWSLVNNSTHLLDLSASNLKGKTGIAIMTEIAQNCDALSKKYQDVKGNPATVLICLGLEFNTQAIVNPTSNDHTDNPNKQAWRQMYRDAYNILRNNANSSVQMVWAGNISQSKEDRIYYWPGTDNSGNQMSQDSVDWVGMTWYPWKGGPTAMESLKGFYEYYAQERNHPFIFMETSADGMGDPATEKTLKENQVTYLYRRATLSQYPNIKGIIWFNVIKGEESVTKNFLFPDGQWDNHGKSASTPGTLYSAANRSLMMSSLYPNGIVDSFFLGPTGPLVDSEFDVHVVTAKAAGGSRLSVRFRDESKGFSIRSWQWDVDGDDEIEYSSRNATHSYEQRGAYLVTLTIRSGNLINSEARWVKVPGGLPPERVFIALATNPENASIYVGRTLIGTASAANQFFWAPAGTHQIRIKAGGYRGWVGRYALEWPQMKDFGTIRLKRASGETP